MIKQISPDEYKNVKLGHHYWNAEIGEGHTVVINPSELVAMVLERPFANTLAGIELSADLLESHCGFAPRFHGKEFFIEAGDLKIIWSKKDNRLILEGNGGYYDAGEMDLSETHKYLHQIQDLYYGLTMKELIIK